jgi:predicted nucleic acid-binding protein
MDTSGWVALKHKGDTFWQMFKRYTDKAFSFTDCTSFVVMRHHGIWEAFTNDHNFEQVGYQRLLT